MAAAEETLDNQDSVQAQSPVAEARGFEAPRRQPTVHPVVYGISVAGLVWIVGIAALTFGSGGHMPLNMAIVAGVLLAFVALPLGAAGLIGARNRLDPNRPGPDEGHQRLPFAAWRMRHIPLWGGTLRGGAAAAQVALLPVLLALGFTVMMLVAVWARAGIVG